MAATDARLEELEIKVIRLEELEEKVRRLEEIIDSPKGKTHRLFYWTEFSWKERLVPQNVSRTWYLGPVSDIRNGLDRSRQTKRRR